MKRTVSKTEASETRGTGASKKTRVSKQTGEAARREPLSPVSSICVARRDENAVNGGGSRTRRGPPSPQGELFAGSGI